MSRPVVIMIAMALAGAGGLFTGCLSTMAPKVARTDHHHEMLEVSTGTQTCLGCHESEAVAKQRLASMGTDDRDAEMALMMDGGGAPLVADWMVKDVRGCVQCHRVAP